MSFSFFPSLLTLCIPQLYLSFSFRKCMYLTRSTVQERKIRAVVKYKVNLCYPLQHPRVKAVLVVIAGFLPSDSVPDIRLERCHVMFHLPAEHPNFLMILETVDQVGEGGGRGGYMWVNSFGTGSCSRRLQV